MNDVILKAEGISKRFSLSSKESRAPKFFDLLKSMIGIETNFSTGEKDFWALDSVSFELNRGENLGIVGLNGAGKSTLLKIILGRLTPDRGSVQVNGRMGGLIELGAGFHPEQTGRRNIFLNAKLLGITDKEIAAKLDDIIDFAELHEFIDMPVKTYSSGMSIRLGFSIAIHFVKDLIVCDEILAVGDFEFKQKCYKKIHKLKHSRSFILVSHNTRDIALFCDKALLLHKGVCIEYSDAQSVVEKYALASHELTLEQYREKLNSKDVEKIGLIDEIEKDSSDIGSDAVINESVEVRNSLFGPIFHDNKGVGNVAIRSNLPIVDGELHITNKDRFTLWIQFELFEDVTHLRVGLPIFSEDGRMVLGPDSRCIAPKSPKCTAAGEKIFKFDFRTCPFNEGRFFIVVALSNDPGYLYRNHLVWLNVKNVNGEFGIVRTNSLVHVEIN